MCRVIRAGARGCRCGLDMGAVCGVAFCRLVWYDGVMEWDAPESDLLTALDEQLKELLAADEVQGLPGVTQNDLEEIRAGLERLEGRGQYVASPR